MDEPHGRPCLDDFIPVKAFSRRYPYLGTEASWRWRIFNAEHNGLADAGVIVRSGRRIYIVAPRALDFYLSQAA